MLVPPLDGSGALNLDYLDSLGCFSVLLAVFINFAKEHDMVKIGRCMSFHGVVGRFRGLRGARAGAPSISIRAECDNLGLEHRDRARSQCKKRRACGSSTGREEEVQHL